MTTSHPKPVLDYFHRIGAEVLNFRRAMVKSYKGAYYIERAIVKIGADGTVSCSNKDFAPTAEEAAAMKAALEGVAFPRTIRARNSAGLKGLAKGELFEFVDRKTGEIIMVQERRMNKNGTKAYVPWVLLSDGDWVSMEPDGDLPFWKPKEGRGPGAKIMIHEGAKAAAAVTTLVARAADDHPWIEELAEYEHWGMIGGALAPHRADYEELHDEKPTEVIYVCDNDQPGTMALQKVSRCWGKGLKGVIFGKAFPPSWDMADPIPKSLYTRSGRYVGPRLKELFEGATFATELVPNPAEKGRPVTIIRPEFCEEWMHCITPEAFVHRDWPNRILTATEFNSKVAPFSHVDETARLLKKQFSSKSAVLKYVPGETPGIYGGGTSGIYINTFCPSSIKPEPGDAGPWLEFLERLVPDEGDRNELMRWCATLIARPAVKMLYGLLMISEMQGVGKGTLGEKILAPLVGEINVSYPSEQEIVDSNFNYWLAHKRLAVVHEIYAGNSSKAYNKLKSTITDKYVTVQKKYQANYEIESWIHIFACSNSMRALKLSMDDRRWLVPKLSEDKRPSKYWEGFNAWLTQDGGLQAIAAWAEAFVTEHGAVERGAEAPWTALKRQIVEEAYSPGQMLVSQTLEALRQRVESGELGVETFILDSQLVELIKQRLYDGRQNDHLERPATVRAVAKAQGWHAGDARAQVKGWGVENMGARVLSLCPTTAGMAPSMLGGEGVDPRDRRKPIDLQAMMSF